MPCNAVWSLANSCQRLSRRFSSIQNAILFIASARLQISLKYEGGANVCSKGWKWQIDLSLWIDPVHRLQTWENWQSSISFWVTIRFRSLMIDWFTPLIDEIWNCSWGVFPTNNCRAILISVDLYTLYLLPHNGCMTRLKALCESAQSWLMTI